MTRFQFLSIILMMQSSVLFSVCHASRQASDDSPKLMALSFDDGPNTVTTPKVLDVLEKYGVPASFFVIGQEITPESAPLMLRAMRLGCTIENHSWTHQHMAELTADSIVSEIQRTSALVEHYTGRRPQLFRPPFISVSDSMYMVIDLPFICGDSSDDWMADLDVEGRIRNIRERATDGSIILMHDFAGNDRTAEALDTLIPQLLAEGVRFVTVPELFGLRGVVPEAHSGIVWSRVPRADAHRDSCGVWQRLEADAFGKVAGDTLYTLLDVRHPDEFADAHLPGALNIDVQTDGFLSTALRTLDASRPVALYCRSGRRSQMASRQLAGYGFTVAELATGIQGWQEAGGEVVSGQPVECFVTPEGHTAYVHLIHHGTLAVSYRGTTIHIDPVTRMGDHTVADLSAFGKADAIVVTHEHGDHLQPEAISQLSDAHTRLFLNSRSLASTQWGDTIRQGDVRQLTPHITLTAVPAYNTTAGREKFHPQGNGFGVVIDLDGLRLYVSGDTEDIPEMARLSGTIDVAFLSANQPYTMTVSQCVRAARIIRPRVLIPYHLGDTDAEAIRQGLAGSGIDVRLHDEMQ